MAPPKFEILTKSRFYLELKLDGSQEPIDGYFMECQGFKRTQEIIEIAEVTPQTWGKNGTTKYGRVVRTKIPGNPKSENITLRRGLTISMTFWQWFKAIEEGKWADQFRDGDLTIYDQGHVEAARFRFLQAWPTNYKIAEVKAGANDFEVEEIELAVDEFIRIK